MTTPDTTPALIDGPVADAAVRNPHWVRPHDDAVAFDELQDSAPSGGFRLSATGWIGIAAVAFWLLVALLGPTLAPWGENALPFPDDYAEFQAPRPGAWLGTDVLDRDILSRVAWGARRTIAISVSATVLAYALGVTLGIGAAVAGGWTDTVLSRVNDAFLSLPSIMLGLVVVAAVGSSTTVLIFTAGVIFATVVFRLARAIGQEIMVMDYVEAARARGEGIWWIVSSEIWPNARMPLISDFGLRLIYVILFVSSLSFLGLGVQPPYADWGSMVRENLGALQYGESVVPVLGPAIAIATLTIGINFVVDDLSAHAGGKLAGRI